MVRARKDPISPCSHGGCLARIDTRGGNTYMYPNRFPRMITTRALFIERTRALLVWKWRAIRIARTAPSHAVRSDAIVAAVVVEIGECVYSTVQEMGYLRAAACICLYACGYGRAVYAIAARPYASKAMADAHMSPSSNSDVVLPMPPRWLSPLL